MHRLRAVRSACTLVLAATLGACATPSPTGTPAASGAGHLAVRAYFILGSFQDNPGLVPVERSIDAGAGGTAEREAVMALLAGPNAAELGGRPAMVTDIPPGTRLLDVSVSGATATVDLSGEFFDQGAPGSLRGRLAEVVYTLTQFPGIASVVFKSTGESFGRADFADQLPAIFVDGPAWGSVIANPLHLSGTADAFEATFHVRLLAPDGRSLADGPVMATCGSGCRGTFDVMVPYAATASGPATLQVYDLSEEDGSLVLLTEYPVTLTPGP